MSQPPGQPRSVLLLSQDKHSYSSVDNRDSPDESTKPEFQKDAYGERIGGSSGVLASTINLVKSMMGAGILVMPWAFSLASLIPTLLLLVLALLFSTQSFIYISKCSLITGKQLYSEIWEVIYGKKYAAFPDIIIFFMNFFTLAGYVILVGDFVPEVAASFDPSSIFANRTYAISIIAVCVLLPLSLLKDMNSLRFTSYIGCVCLVYTSFAVAVRSIQLSQRTSDITADDGHTIFGDETGWELFSVDLRIFIAISIFVYAFDGHCNAPIMFSEHKVSGGSFQEWKKISRNGMIIVFVFSTLFGFFGYFAFGNNTPENILLGFELNDPVMVVARLAMAFSVTSTYPFWFNSLRRSFDGLLLRCLPRTVSRQYSRLTNRRLVQTFIFVGLTVGLALIVSDIGPFIAFTAAAFGCFEMYIIPGMLYLKVGNFTKDGDKLYVYGMIGFGVISGVCGVVVTLIDWVQ